MVMVFAGFKSLSVIEGIKKNTLDNMITMETQQITEIIIKGKKKLKNQRKSRDHFNYSIIKIDQSTEKSPGNWRRLAITQTPEKKTIN